MEREGLLTRVQQGRQTYVTAKDGAPEAPKADAGAVAETTTDAPGADPTPPRASPSGPDEDAIPDPDEEG
jgi:hypothetical protein